MNIQELSVPDRLAIAITSMARVGGKIYLGLTGGPRLLAVYDTATGGISMASDSSMWLFVILQIIYWMSQHFVFLFFGTLYVGLLARTRFWDTGWVRISCVGRECSAGCSAAGGQIGFYACA